ncbi:MAG: TIGR02594 family protein [Pseudomonadota bacterium]
MALTLQNHGAIFHAMRATEALTATQNRLASLGWYAGKIDGREGHLTDLALTDFKRASGLRARPKIGPITLTRLFARGATRKPVPLPNLSAQPWMHEAKRLLGTKEYAGDANNPIIMDWADNLDIHYTGDDVPWCGLLVAHCLNFGAPDDPQDFNRLAAREWRKYARSVDPQLGALLVIWRGSRDGWQGHVGFYVGEDAEAYHVLGGNQGNSVSVVRIAKDRLLDARYPKSFAPTGKIVLVDDRSSLSTNEQ